MPLGQNVYLAATFRLLISSKMVLLSTVYRLANGLIKEEIEIEQNSVTSDLIKQTKT